jgi:cytidylate kinase
VAEGRDCGTVVFPQAQAKIYLTASSEHRAARRAAELGLDQGDMQEAQKVRDRQDSTRKAAPLQVPENALVVDTTELGLDEVVAKVESFVRGKIN